MNKVIEELQAASEWFAEHGRNTNTAIVGICDRAIGLINRQKAEIDEQNTKIERLNYILESYALQYGTVVGKKRLLRKARAEAVKEFAERLKTKVDGWYYDFAKFDDTMDALMEIANLVKEFTEGDPK